MRRIFLFILFISIISCDDITKTDLDETRSMFVEHYTDMAYEKYSDCLFFAELLKSDLDTFLEDPNETTYQRLKTVWEHIRVPFGQSLVYRYLGGPIEENDLYYKINAPLLNIELIENSSDNGDPGIINDDDNYPEINVPLIRSLYVEQTHDQQQKTYAGMHVIEYLLWGSDDSLDPALSGNRPFTDLIDDDLSIRRLNYFVSVLEVLISDLKYLQEQWIENSSFRNEFGSKDSQDALYYIYYSLIKFIDDDLSDRMLNRIIENGKSFEEESPFSDFTLNDIKYGVIGVENIFIGAYTDTQGEVLEGTGIIDILEDSNKTSGEIVLQNINSIKELLSLINGPFDNSLQNNEIQKLIELHDLLKNLQMSVINTAVDLDLKYQG